VRRESDPDTASAAGGRPDERFPRAPTQPPTRTIGPEGEPKEILVSVVAKVNATQSQGKIRFVNPTPGGRPSALDRESAALLRVKGATDQVLSEHRVPVKLFTERAPKADREGLVDAIIPVSPAARTIELVINGQVADAARVGGTPPAVRGVQRVAVEEKEAGIVLALDRHLDEGHTFSVQVSTDQGQTWQTVGVGLREPTFAIDRRQFRAGQEVQVRVIVTNGLSSSVVMGEPFRS
jgi:hypothetical protein